MTNVWNPEEVMTQLTFQLDVGVLVSRREYALSMMHDIKATKVASMYGPKFDFEQMTVTLGAGSIRFFSKADHARGFWFNTIHIPTTADPVSDRDIELMKTRLFNGENK